MENISAGSAEGCLRDRCWRLGIEPVRRDGKRGICYSYVMMRTSFCETGFVKHASTAAVIALKFAILLLVVISVNETFETMSSVISDIRHQNDLILAGVLATVLVPSGGVVFWGCRAVL